MSEQIVKILPTNRFSEEAVPAAFTGSKLLDFNMPGGLGTYDLSNSYININASIIQEIDPAHSAIQGLVVGKDTALFSTEIELQTGSTANDTYVVGCASLVRNAQMYSQNRGMVESIRRCDTLRQVLYNLENDKKEIENGLNKFGTFNGRRGPNNKTSSFQNTVVNNTNSNGVVDLNNKSKEYLPVKNLIIDQPNTFKDKENIKKKNKQNYIPKEISLNYTLSHTYKNVYSSNPR